MPQQLPYIMFIAFLGLSAFIYEFAKSSRQCLTCNVLSISAFLFFVGLRGFIMSDWIVYYPMFEDYTWSDVIWTIGGKHKYVEPGYVIYMMSFKTLCNNYFMFSFFSTAINLALLLSFFYRIRIKNFGLVLMLYFIFDGMGISINLMRNSIAIFIFLHATICIKQRKPIQYIILCTIACTFHISSIIFFPLYFILNYKLNKWIYMLIFVALNIIFISKFSVFTRIAEVIGLRDIFVVQMKEYTEIHDAGRIIFSIGYFERLFTGTLIFLYYDSLLKVQDKNHIYINAILIYFFCFFAFGDLSIISSRFALLFAFGYWVIWIDLLHSFKITNNRYLFGGFIYIYCLLRIAGSTYLPDFKYENILFDASSYEQRLMYHNKTYEEV